MGELREQETKPWWKTDMSYEEVKGFISANIKNIARSFISVGYYLKVVRDRGLYLEGGYGSVWEFAQDTYGMSRTTASRWMGINDRFSVDGNSPVLDDKYQEYGKSQLQEMLYLPEKGMGRVTPDMTVREIREAGKGPEAVKRRQQESGECAMSHTKDGQCLEAEKDIAENMEEWEMDTEYDEDVEITAKSLLKEEEENLDYMWRVFSGKVADRLPPLCLKSRKLLWML